MNRNFRQSRIVLAVSALALSVAPRQALAQSSPVQIPTGFPVTCAPEQVQVMLLGTYHFAGSTDAIQTPAEDVLSERRQNELETLVASLARWAPQQIAVEWPLSFTDSATARYKRYQESGTSESRNEVVQIGFRLARRLGHPNVYPIDHRMPIGNDSLSALHERRPEFRERQRSLMAMLDAHADSTIAWQRRTTLTEHLRDANTDASLRNGNSLAMFGSFLAAGDGDNLGGPRLLARWYERNIIMAHNITRVLQPGTKRVLLLVGSGHVPPLRNILDESPDFCPVSPLPYLQ